MNSWNVAFDGVKCCLKAGVRGFVVCAGARNAAVELLPAVIEAFYQARPLVAITVDRPVAFRGTGAPQSIEQLGIFGNHAWQGTIADWDGKQPLHLNAEFEEAFDPNDENFSRETPGDFTPAEDRLDVAALARWLREEHYKGIVVLVGGLEPDEREDVFHFSCELGVPLVAEMVTKS